jgi:hypothetical protein
MEEHFIFMSEWCGISAKQVNANPIPDFLSADVKLSRMVAKDKITGVLRAPFVSYVRSAGAGEVEEEPRGAVESSAELAL